ncbi:hypothetical protein DL96DRAFT_56610 [Flagelloscypha sp. PMI_526]|nr:hypothetical protein DL96DRAFT_56610 [Flagelloscypha sp. PMI_526]
MLISLSLHPSFVPPTMEDPEEALWGFMFCNYSSMAALTWTIYDMVLSFGQEVEFIWSGSWSNFKRLYLCLRWFTLIAQIVPTIITLKIASGALRETTQLCRALMGFQAMSSQVLMFCVQFILILRVIALYYEHARLLKRVLMPIWITQMLAMTILFGVSAKDIEYGVHCVIVGFPTTVAFYLLIPMVFETALFILTMWKFWRTIRNNWGQETLLTRFMKDGIWAFALPFCTPSIYPVKKTQH